MVLNFSFSGTVTDVGNLIFTLFNVMLTLFQSSCMISHKILFHNFTYYGANFPVILKKFILPAVIHNVNATSCCTADRNNMTFIVFENKMLSNCFGSVALK